MQAINIIEVLDNLSTSSVVYFDQRLGAAHSKRWSKKSFSAFLVLIALKKQEICSKILQKKMFF